MNQQTDQYLNEFGFSSKLQINDMDWILKPQTDPKTKILKGGLAISNIRYCENRQLIEKDQFKAIVSVCGDKLNKPDDVEHLWIVVSDHPEENIDTFFNSTFNFIDKHIKNGNVLVHCQAGISRSVTIVVAYLIRKNNIQFQQALLMVKCERPIAQPNKGFTKQLKKFSRERNEKSRNSFPWPFKFCWS